MFPYIQADLNPPHLLVEHVLLGDRDGGVPHKPFMITQQCCRPKFVKLLLRGEVGTGQEGTMVKLGSAAFRKRGTQKQVNNAQGPKSCINLLRLPQ